MSETLKVHVVIHVNDVASAAAQCAEVEAAGLGSVFLIDHHSRAPRTLFDTVAAVRDSCPSLKVGVNLLLTDPSIAAAHVAAAISAGELGGIDALWCDDITGGDDTGTLAAAVRSACSTGPLAAVDLFGGVAFKYTRRHTDDPDEAATEARLWAGYVDAVTTSGPGTNHSANLDKVAAVAAATPPAKRVALASGVSPENVAAYAPWCTDVLVASSLETEPYSGVLRPERLAAMFDATVDLPAGTAR